VTLFSRYRSQPSGNSGGQKDNTQTAMSRCELDRAYRE